MRRQFPFGRVLTASLIDILEVQFFIAVNREIISDGISAIRAMTLACAPKARMVGFRS